MNISTIVQMSRYLVPIKFTDPASLKSLWPVKRTCTNLLLVQCSRSGLSSRPRLRFPSSEGKGNNSGGVVATETKTSLHQKYAFEIRLR